MPENLTAAHCERVNPAIITWAKLEYARRVALQQIEKLLSDFATIEDRDVKEMLSHVISIGGTYIAEIERQKDSDSIASSEHYIDLLKVHLDAVWWIDGLHCIYPAPREREKTMLDLLEASASFLKETIGGEFPTTVIQPTEGTPAQ